jgi:phosphate transport system substrate-binding protein
MYRRALLVTLAIVATAMVMPHNGSTEELRLVGSGAAFPFPIYSAWFKDFNDRHSGVTIDYQPKGSGAGIEDFIHNIVDFAGSGAAMTDEQIANVANGVVLLPITAGELVLAYNLPDTRKELKLARDVLSAI